MLRRILVPHDGSDMATRALEYALENHPDAEITVLHVAGEPSPMMGKAIRLALETDIEAAAEAVAAEIFETAREVADDHGAEIDTMVALGNPARRIIDQAEEYDAVVMGTHGGDLATTLLTGNVASKVSQRAPVPVTLVR